MWRFIAKMGKEVDAEGTHKPLSFLWVSSFVENSLPPAEETQSQRPLNLLCDQKIS